MNPIASARQHRTNLEQASANYQDSVQKAENDGRYSPEYRAELKAAALARFQATTIANMKVAGPAVRKAREATLKQLHAAQKLIDADTNFDAVPVLARAAAAELRAADDGVGGDALRDAFEARVQAAAAAGDRTTLHALMAVTHDEGDMFGSTAERYMRQQTVAKALTQAVPAEVTDAAATIAALDAEYRRIVDAAYKAESVWSSYDNGTDGWWGGPSPMRELLEPETIRPRGRNLSPDGMRSTPLVVASEQAAG
jgi:hypothetical protein